MLSAKAPNEPTPFIRAEDQEVWDRYKDEAFEVQVGLVRICIAFRPEAKLTSLQHELLGHGCGKLLQETSPGVYNFDIKTPPANPITGKPVAKWYRPGETWGTVFGGLTPYCLACS